VKSKRVGSIQDEGPRADCTTFVAPLPAPIVVQGPTCLRKNEDLDKSSAQALSDTVSGVGTFQQAPSTQTPPSIESINDAKWDTPLSPEQLRRLSPSEKQRRAQAAVSRKVELLEAFERGEEVQGVEDPLPTTRTALRRWDDPKRRLWAWSDPEVDRPDGRNAGLVGRFKAVAERLAKQARRGHRASAIEAVRQREAIAALIRQNADQFKANVLLAQRAAEAERALAICKSEREKLIIHANSTSNLESMSELMSQLLSELRSRKVDA